MFTQNSKRKKKQNVKIHGFRFPQQLLEDIREFQKETGIKFPASAYAALFAILKQIHHEHSATGELQEFVLASYSKEFKVAYSTMYSGYKFLEAHNFISESIKNGEPVVVLANFKEYTTPELREHKLNYFTIPHTLFQTNIVAEFVRTSNGRAFELLLSLLTQFRHSVAKVDKVGKVSELTQTRNMSTLKRDLNKRAKSVRLVLETLESLFNVKYVGMKVRGVQLWIDKVIFSLKPECVIENTDEFEVSPLVSSFSENTEYILSRNQVKYKPRDLFDIMISFKQEAINVLKYIMKEDVSEEFNKFSERDSFLQSYFYQCLYAFEERVADLKKTEVKFTIKKSLGAYFRTIFRHNLKSFVETHIDYATYINTANFREYESTGKIPAMYNLLNA